MKKGILKVSVVTGVIAALAYIFISVSGQEFGSSLANAILNGSSSQLDTFIKVLYVFSFAACVSALTAIIYAVVEFMGVYKKKTSVDLYTMLREVEVGDIIYLKSTYPQKGTGMILRIKAIGKVVNPNKKYEGKSALGVEYIKDFTTTNLVLREYRGKNSVYRSTFYQEYNPFIVEKILKYL